jgi:hypothetical protein
MQQVTWPLKFFAEDGVGSLLHKIYKLVEIGSLHELFREPLSYAVCRRAIR